MSIEDDLETDVESLRRELLDWILTEIRSSGRRETHAPLAQDLVEVVRGGLQGAVDQALQRVEEARVDGVVEALNPTFDEFAKALRGLQASLQASIAAELSERTADADARFAGLERSILAVQKTLGVVGERAAAPQRVGGPDRTDEVLREIRKLSGGARSETQGGVESERGAEPSAAGPTWLAVLAIAAGAALVAGLGGWFAHGTRPAALAQEPDVAGQARQLQTSLADLVGAEPAGGSAVAPKIDQQAVAGDAADVAAAIERAATAATPDELTTAHQQANDALAHLRAALAPTGALVSPGSSTQTQPTTPPPRPSVQHATRTPAAALRHPAPAAAPTSPPAPPAGAPPAAAGGGGGT